MVLNELISMHERVTNKIFCHLEIKARAFHEIKGLDNEVIPKRKRLRAFCTSRNECSAYYQQQGKKSVARILPNRRAWFLQPACSDVMVPSSGASFTILTRLLTTWKKSTILYFVHA